MPDWLAGAFPSDAELRWPIILVRLLAALAVGAVVAAIYRATRRRPAAVGDLSQTLLLLAVVIAMITLAIGDNAARAFSLVGALAIVRFRSVVEDPRDTAFVILAVAVGLAVGAGFIWVPVMGLPIAGAVAWAFAGAESRRAAGPSRCRIVVRTDGSTPPGAVRASLERHLDGCRQRRIETVKKGTLVEQVWSGRLRVADGGEGLVAALRDTPGVTAVDVVFPD
ncbi:MAG: DUF4956 domain-containing protein [Planctomycetaceae bacterium]